MASFAISRTVLPVRAGIRNTQAPRARVVAVAPKVRVAAQAGLSMRLNVAPALPMRAAVKRVTRTAKPSTVCAASSESTGFVAKLNEKFPWLETTFYFGLWYILNVNFNIINKQIYNYFPYPWFVSCIHLAAGLVIAGVFWATKLVPFEKPSKKFMDGVLIVALCHAVGHSLTNVSFANVAVSFTHTIKTLEPVFSSIGSYLVNGTVYSPVIYASLLPIMGGVALCSATELSFTWLGFLCAMASNILFAARAIFSKNLMKGEDGKKGMNPINVYNYVSMIALIFCIPPVFFFEWGTLPAAMAGCVTKFGASKFYWDLWNCGMYYHLYNQVAYQALGKVEPVTHAVGNVGKRIFVIGFSILAFGNKLSTQSIVGSVIAIGGAGLYGFLKGKEAETAAKASA